MGIVNLGSMLFIVGGQWVEISEIKLASRTLTDDQLRGLVDDDHVRGVVEMAVEQERSIPGLRKRFLNDGAIVLPGGLFLLKDKAMVRHL